MNDPEEDFDWDTPIGEYPEMPMRKEAWKKTSSTSSFQKLTNTIQEVKEKGDNLLLKTRKSLKKLLKKIR
jgi:hypothetical protein